MAEKIRTSTLVFIAAFALAGSTPAAIGISGLREAVLATYYSQPVSGVIDRFECPRRSKGCAVVVRFVHPDGSSQELVEQNANPAPNFTAGSPVRVLIRNQGKRELVRLDRAFYLWLPPLLLCVFSIPFLGCAGLLTLDAIRGKKKRHKRELPEIDSAARKKLGNTG